MPSILGMAFAVLRRTPSRLAAVLVLGVPLWQAEDACRGGRGPGAGPVPAGAGTAVGLPGAPIVVGAGYHPRKRRGSPGVGRV